MKKLQLNFIPFFCFAFLSFYSQKNDSLLIALKNAKHDTVRIIILNLLSKDLDKSNPTQTYNYAKQANKLAIKNNYIPGIANSYFNLGTYYMDIQNNDSALFFFDKGIAITNNTKYKVINAKLEKRKGAVFYYGGLTDSALFYFKRSLSKFEAIKDSAEIIKMLNNIGSIYFRKGDYEGAVSYFLNCLRFDEDKHDVANVAMDYNNLASVFIQKRDFKTAENYLLRALKIGSDLKDTVLLARSRLHLARMYCDKKEFKSSLAQSFETLKLLDKNKDPYNYAAAVNNLGLCYFESGDQENALKYYTESLIIKKQSGDKSGLAATLGNIGTIYYNKKNFAKAIEYYSESEKTAAETGNLAYQVNALYNLHNCYLYTNNADKALELIEKYKLLNDSLYNTTSSGQIAEMQTKYETEKKEKENSELKQKAELQSLQRGYEDQKRKNQLIISLALLGLALIVTFLIYTRKKQRQKALHLAELADAEKLRFKEVIDAEENERSRIARELHDGLGQLLSVARLNVALLEDVVPTEDKPDLDRSLKIIDEACSEVRNISHNMMPSALIRLGLMPAIKEVVLNVNAARGLRIDFSTNLETSLGRSLDITIYRIVQEILNNMIRHSKADLINLSLTKNESDLEIMIRDNGIGFDTDKINESKGMGWKNIFSRISMLDGTIKLESELQKGTLVYINLKLKNG